MDWMWACMDPCTPGLFFFWGYGISGCESGIFVLLLANSSPSNLPFTMTVANSLPEGSRPRLRFSLFQLNILVTFMEVRHNWELFYDHSQPHCRGVSKRQAYDKMATFFICEIAQAPTEIQGLTVAVIDAAVVERRWNGILKTVFGAKAPKVGVIHRPAPNEDNDNNHNNSGSPPQGSKTKFSRSTGHGVFNNKTKMTKSPFDERIRNMFGKNPRFDPVAIRNFGQVSSEGST